jgi:hypothetical protein
MTQCVLLITISFTLFFSTVTTQVQVTTEQAPNRRCGCARLAPSSGETVAPLQSVPLQGGHLVYVKGEGMNKWKRKIQSLLLSITLATRYQHYYTSVPSEN